MNVLNEAMKAARFAEVEHMSLQVVLVGPLSLKSNPPMAIQVCIVAVLSAVNSV